MLPIVLVLFVASGALAAPSVEITQFTTNEIPPPKDTGALVNSGITQGLIERVLDGGDTNIYILTIEQILNDLANLKGRRNQAIALAQTLAVVGELSVGVPGDVCTAANAINAFVSGRPGAARAYLGRLAANIDNITTLSLNPNALRYAVGPRGNCRGGGRIYEFEAAWDSILNNASSASIGLINEEYCAAKRLYSAFNARSNNVGAAVTAATLSPIVDAVQNALVPLANFLRIVVNGGNPTAAASVAKAALLR